MQQTQSLNQGEQAIFALRQLYESYGYLPYKMSRFEEYDFYVRNKDFLLSDRIITFTGEGSKLLALRPDVTLSIIKNAPEEPGVVQKLYYNENVYRAEKSSGSIREMLQAGLECVGDLGSYEIAEVTVLAARSLQKLGSRWVLDLSHMGLIESVLDSCKVPQESRPEVLRCLQQKSPHGMQGIPCRDPEKLQKLFSLSGDPDTVLAELSRVLTTFREQQALQELQTLCTILKNAGLSSGLRIDFSVNNDLKYYSGVVFKGYLQGIPASILSGGQYDKLPRKLGRSAHAIGFALYLDLLEQQLASARTWDVDVLILHDGKTDPALLVAAATEAAAQGSVLVSTSLPRNRTWGKLVEFKDGGVKSC